MAVSELPDFPWDLLEPAKAGAEAHPGGIVDLSVGTPVDPVPEAVREALAAASDAPGYPPTAGTSALLGAIAGWVSRACRTNVSSAALPTIGSKEMVAWLPTLLGIRRGDTVAIPQVCYPTYEVGTLLADAKVVRASSEGSSGPAAPGSAPRRPACQHNPAPAGSRVCAARRSPISRG